MARGMAGIVALPPAIAFAIVVGVSSEKSVQKAIIVVFVISALEPAVYR